jgi:hypothetical protein
MLFIKDKKDAALIQIVHKEGSEILVINLIQQPAQIVVVVRSARSPLLLIIDGCRASRSRSNELTFMSFHNCVKKL